MASLAIGGVVFVAVRAANAVPGGHTRDELTIAGTLSGTSGPVDITFTLEGGAESCVSSASVTPAPGSGSFVANVNTSMCSRALFDGRDLRVSASVRQGMSVLLTTTPANVNAVPYARYAEQYGTPDCPVGYSRESDAATPPGRWFCRDRYGDDVVRVGDGPSAFWIDRYEATVWNARAGAVERATRWFDSEMDVDLTLFPRNGQWRSGGATTAIQPPAYALSVAGAVNLPARWITWFQAQEACRASGKRLPTGEEWLAAAQGTVDPGDSAGASGQCLTNGTAPRTAGGGTLCRSGWGAQDMIGNVWEWTAEWYAGLGLPGTSTPLGAMGQGRHVTWPGTGLFGWPAGYGDDATSGITSGTFEAGGGIRYGVPSAAFRGGGWVTQQQAGVFAIRIDYSPTYSDGGTGFRCVIPR